MAEITAAGIYVQYWLPGLPQWIPALIALVVLLGINLTAVGMFGEFEFWFAIIKVITIIGMILLGVAIIVFGISALGDSASFSNLWSSDGFFPKGFKGPFLALQIVMFAFLGVELIGVTAGEAQNPEKTIPSAINKVIWRILIFYVGALTVIMSLVAWNHLDPKDSPFVVVFSKVGIPAAAGIVNFVVLTAALSSCNSGIFSTGRMLYTLAGFRQAPAALRPQVQRTLTVLDPLRWIAKTKAPLLLQNGKQDEVVPRNALDALAKAAPAGSKVRWYAAGHELNAQAYEDQLAFLQQKLPIHGPDVRGAETGP